MLGDAAQRRFDVLLFWALDRLTREGALETLQYLNKLTGYASPFDPSESRTSIRAARSVTR
jgi:hypothetical protein